MCSLSSWSLVPRSLCCRGSFLFRLCSGCVPAVRLAKSLFLLAKRRNLLLSSCYVEKCSYLCIVFREREGNAGERPLMARKMRTTEFRACVTSVPRPFPFANTKLKISWKNFFSIGNNQPMKVGLCLKLLPVLGRVIVVSLAFMCLGCIFGSVLGLIWICICLLREEMSYDRCF